MRVKASGGRQRIDCNQAARRRLGCVPLAEDKRRGETVAQRRFQLSAKCSGFHGSPSRAQLWESSVAVVCDSRDRLQQPTNYRFNFRFFFAYYDAGKGRLSRWGAARPCLPGRRSASHAVYSERSEEARPEVAVTLAFHVRPPGGAYSRIVMSANDCNDGIVRDAQ